MVLPMVEAFILLIHLVLFFALPITHFLGPAIAYNSILIIRIALSALGAQLLTQSLSRHGIHTWIAGLAYASTPLLCELNNGISEVCAIEWIPFAFWAAVRVLQKTVSVIGFLLGVMQGLASSATFYYGLACALVLFPLFYRCSDKANLYRSFHQEISLRRNLCRLHISHRLFSTRM